MSPLRVVGDGLYVFNVAMELQAYRDFMIELARESGEFILP